MNPKLEKYRNWKDLLNYIILDINGFKVTNEETIGETEITTFTKDMETINVGLIDDELIYIHRNHIETIAYNKYQESDYYHEFDFHPEKDYGRPGLNFEEANVLGIIEELKSGINGEEIQFRNKEDLIKSEVYLEFDKIGKTKIFSFRKDKIGVLKRLKQFISNRKEDSNLKRVELKFQYKFEQMRIE